MTQARAELAESSLPPGLAAPLPSHNAVGESAGTTTLRFLIADDHAIVRRGVRELLAVEFEDVVFGEARDAGEVLSAVHNQEWSLVLLDINMPGRSGLDILKDMLHAQPGLRVLVFSMYADSHYARRALKSGAAGYLSKDNAVEELPLAIRKILGGGRYVKASLAEERLLDLRDTDYPPSHERLSARELEVLRLIASGKTISEIAEVLHIGITTVSTYRARILEKMNMRTTAELMRYSLLNDLLR